jgi:multidrug transporter EmrE-like cation transporter
MKYVYLFLSIAFNVGSYILYKSISNKEVNILWYAIFALGLILGGINILFFTKALKNINLSIAYPVFSGISIFLMVTLSHFIFSERISAVNMAGAVVIIVGIALISN